MPHTNNDKILIKVYGELYTPESIENGDMEKGWHEDDLEFDSIQEALDYMENHGPYEPSCSPADQWDRNCWLATTEPVTDRDHFEKGHDVFFSYHFYCHPLIAQFLWEKLTE